MSASAACYHLPGLFEFYDFYRVFLPLFRQHREYFYDWCRIASLYGAPADCIWGGGRVGSGDRDPREVLALTREYGISARLTFSNSLLRPEHLSDPRCNRLCRLLAESPGPQNGVIVHSDLLLEHLRRTYPGLYFVSSTTKVLTDFSLLCRELERPEFRYVVADFRLNRAFCPYQPELTEEDFYALELGSAGLMRGYMVRPCDGTLTLEKKLRMFLTLSLRGYKVPEEEVRQILRFVEGLDIRTVAEQVMQKLFQALAMHYEFSLSEEAQAAAPAAPEDKEKETKL